jgi:hypothetical protein
MEPIQNIMPQFNNQLNNGCRLTIFTPKQINNKSIYPIVYDFNEGFLETIKDEFNNSLNFNPIKIANNPNSYQCVKPSVDNITLNTSYLSNYWTFLMEVDGELNTIPNLNQSNKIIFNPNNSYKVIYLGFFDQEPVNPNTINLTNPTLNLNASMQITRKTIFKKVTPINNIQTNLRPNVVSDQVIATYDDMIFNPQSNTRFDNSYYLLNPENMEYDDDGVAPLSYENSLNVTDNVGIESKWNSPKTHIKNISTALLDGAYIASSDFMDSSYGVEGFFGALQSIDNSKNISSVHNVGFDPTYEIVSLNVIVNSYNPDILIVNNNQRTEQLSVVDTNTITPETIYGSLIENNITSLLLKWGLSSISLSYDSYTNHLEIFNLEAINVCTQEILKDRFKNCWYNIKTDLLDFIKMSIGEFCLNLHTHISSYTIVNLVFYDYKGIGPEDYMRSFNPLGGIDSNQIGKANHVIKNISDIGVLSQHCSEIFSQPNGVY